MDCKDLKKLLAGLGVAALVSSGGLSLPGGAHAGSGWGAKPSAGSAEQAAEEAAAAGGSEPDSAVSAVQEEAEGAVDSAGEEAKDAVDDATKKIKEEVDKKSGGSGWSGSSN